MAERRMFTKKITDGDAFTSLPPTTQALYFHLCMSADDDGFSNKIRQAMFNAHADQNDFGLLVQHRFIIPFESGVIVIKHWKMHNVIRSDRYHETEYLEEKSRLVLKDNSVYTESDNQLTTNRQPSDNQMETEDRIGKDRLGKVSNNISSKEDISPSELSDDEPKFVLNDIVDKWNELSAYGITKVRFISAESPRHKMIRARIKQYGRDSFDEIVENIKNSDFLQGKSNSKRQFLVDFDWVIKPSNYPKVLEGKYNNRSNANPTPSYEMPTGLEKPKTVRQG